jgi:hypothetical protein
MRIEEQNGILERIEKLERQNRRWKQIALLCVIAIASIVLTDRLLGQTQTPKATKRKPAAAAPAPTAPVVPEKIEAESFVLKDSSGRTRADLAMGGTGPTLRFLDQNGSALITISLNDGTPSGPLLLLSDADHHSSLAMSVQQGAGSQLSLTGNQNALIHVGVTNDGSALELFDQDGFSTSIGNGMKLSKNGKTQQTSAASIALFNKDHKVLWSEP